MNYNIIISENFKKEFKPLAKKYPSLKSDLQEVLDNIDKTNLVFGSIYNKSDFESIDVFALREILGL